MREFMSRFGKVMFIATVMVFTGVVASAEDVENRMAVNEYPVIQMDPALVCDNFDTGVFYNLYDGLVYPTPEGTYRPHLAEKWEVSPDGKVWTFYLRSGVKFHDGSELTAEDVAFSMNRALTIGQGYSGFWRDVESVNVKGPYEVVFNLSRPNAVFGATLVMLGVLDKDLVLQHLKKPGDYGDMGDYGIAWLGGHDAGSGPYMAVEYKPGEHLSTQRFKDYWMGWESWGPNLVPIENGLFRELFEGATVKTLMKNRDHDLSDWHQPDEWFSSIDALEGINVIDMPIPVIYIAWLNTQRPPTDDIHFRKAILYAFDYQGIVDAIEGATKAVGPIPSLFPGHDPGAFTYTRDLDKARAELKQSKYTPGEMEMEYMATAGVEIFEKVGLQWQANLAELGIKLKVSVTPWSRQAGAVAKAETTPNAAIYLFTAYYPSTDWFLTYMYHPDNPSGVFAGHWLNDPELGDLIDRGKAPLDENKRLALYKELQAKIMDRALALYVCQKPKRHAIQAYIAGPKEVCPVLGPEWNLRNYRIDLKKKAEYMK